MIKIQVRTETMTRDAAIEAAAETFVAGMALRDSLPPRAAAEAAWTPSGPSVDELERRIRADRGMPVDRVGESVQQPRTSRFSPGPDAA